MLDRRSFHRGIFLAAILALTCLIPLGLHAQRQPGDRVLAMVGGKIFTVRDLEMWLFETRLTDPSARSVPDEQLRRKVLPRLIDEYLLEAWAIQKMQPPPDEAVETHAQEMAASFEEMARGREGLNRRLYSAGIDPEEFRVWIKNMARQSLMIRDAVSAHANLGGLDPMDTGVEEAIRLKIAHILVEAKSSSPEEQQQARERALQIRRDIAAGISFAQAARLYSDDLATRNASGYLGWFEVGELNPSLWRAAVQVRPGDTSEPVQSGGDYHILRVLDYVTEAQSEYMKRMRAEEEVQLRRLRKETNIILAEGYELKPLGAAGIAE